MARETDVKCRISIKHTKIFNSLFLLEDQHVQDGTTIFFFEESYNLTYYYYYYYYY